MSRLRLWMPSRLRRRIKSGRERGAVAIILAIAMLMLLASAALGYDIAKLAYERQALRAAVDAGAQAGGYAIKDGISAATAEAKRFAVLNAGDLGLVESQVQVSTFCTLGLKAGTTSTPDSTQIPYICNPGTGWVVGTAATGCNSEVCVVPCRGTGAVCNTIKVSVTKTVQFLFGPAINIPTGTTGAVSSASCKGPCGGEAPPNPMDVVVMADRTYSMSADAVDDLKGGLKTMLGKMTREHQFVAFGAIHKSQTDGSCVTDVADDDRDMYTSDSYSSSWWGGRTLNDEAKFKGTWVPVGYSSNYTTGSLATDNLTLNASSTLVKSINCMKRRDNSIGTHLAAALKGAAKYVLNPANVTSNVPAAVIAQRALLEKPVRKVIIFETDGRPDEVLDGADTNRSLNNDWDIGAADDGEKGCTNLKNVATSIKALPDDVLIITIGYGDVNYMTCAKDTRGDEPYDNVRGSSKVKDVLAQVASPASPTVASTADKSTCALENADNDFYFCAANGDELDSVFRSAFGQIGDKTKFIKVPGVGD